MLDTLKADVSQQSLQCVCGAPATVDRCDVSVNDDRYKRVEFVNDSVVSCVIT